MGELGESVSQPQQGPVSGERRGAGRGPGTVMLDSATGGDCVWRVPNTTPRFDLQKGLLTQKSYSLCSCVLWLIGVKGNR